MITSTKSQFIGYINRVIFDDYPERAYLHTTYRTPLLAGNIK